ncbi:RING finger domain-containing protein [Ascosphaera apis ARSEF 7405]|uniref:RBR-type E3 ubiquitin transferase n=1 Tax=Ascosphaera apis ARSEF 7405 TaxID=392613 RepID=A0A162IPV4_9EURO|nr:RING finger domain-containing protein [Ascosphaera apis ARSEF 7405]
MDSDDDFTSDVSSQDFLEGSEDESISDEFEDYDAGNDGSFYDKDIIKPQKKAFEVDYRGLSPDDITKEQNDQINEVSAIFGLPTESCAILFRYMRWNKEKLMERYMDDPESLLDAAGIDLLPTKPHIETIPATCEICYNDEPGMKTYAMRCGHRFCTDCYRHYLGQKIWEEGEAAHIQCPQDNCNRIVDSKTLELLVSDDMKDRYHTLLMRTYVDDKDNLKWCPAPECQYAVDCPVKKRELDRIVPTVNCLCGHCFCFGCTLDDHQPAPCGLVKQWLKKCKDDSETANWISAHTKECPRCQSTIEKNGGCNHMTCRKCKYEFCWMCMGVWSEHGTSWYNCNRYEEKSGSAARDAQARSRAFLERYLHYYNRYANHEQSARLDKDLYIKTEKKMLSLQTQSTMSWIEVQFLDTASRTLQKCRQTLKWTYAFAFYLQRNNQTEIFEDNQKDLELAVESLSEMFEKPVNELAKLRVDILDKTAYCNKRRAILLSDTAERIKNSEWAFNTHLNP